MVIDMVIICETHWYNDTSLNYF